MDDMNSRNEDLRRLVASLREDLALTVRDSTATQELESAKEKLSRWKDRAVELIGKHISLKEARSLQRKRRANLFLVDPMGNIKEAAKMYDSFLQGLDDQLRLYPSQILDPSVSLQMEPPHTEDVQPSEAPAIFLIHGRDQTNLLRLDRLLRERWSLHPLIMSDQPGKGRALIEKFEQEAEPAVFAIALITPDDIVSTTDGQYAQARPNVVFELGWFYGRLGRAHVCILFKKGTHLHSDLEGISRIEFVDDITEKALAIEDELIAASILTR